MVINATLIGSLDNAAEIIGNVLSDKILRPSHEQVFSARRSADVDWQLVVNTYEGYPGDELFVSKEYSLVRHTRTVSGPTAFASSLKENAYDDQCATAPEGWQFDEASLQTGEWTLSDGKEGAIGSVYIDKNHDDHDHTLCPNLEYNNQYKVYRKGSSVCLSVIARPACQGNRQEIGGYLKLEAFRYEWTIAGR